MERRMSRKLSCTVWSGGKTGDNFKSLPIAIGKSTSDHKPVWWRSYERKWYSKAYADQTGSEPGDCEDGEEGNFGYTV